MTYNTSFPATESPLSESGSWINGLAVGLDWNNMQSALGNAIGTAFIPSGFSDNLAILTGFPPDHFIEGIVHRAGGYTPATTHELELLLRFSVSAHDAHGYEILNDTAGGSDIVIWNGAPSDFVTGQATSGAGAGGIAHGDVIRGEAQGNVLTAFKNGVQFYQATGITWATGNPGIGTFCRGGDGVLANLGWQSIIAGPLPQQVGFVSSVSATPGTASTVAIDTTVTGTNPVLIVKIWLNHATATINSMVWSLGSGAAVKIKEVRGANGVLVSVWAIPAPAAGAGTMTATLSASVLSGGNASLFIGADQGTPCPIGDSVSSISNAVTVVLTPTGLTSLDASDGAGANIIAGNWNTAAPNQRFVNNASDPGYLVGDADATTGITFTSSGMSVGDVALVAVRIQSPLIVPATFSRANMIAPTQRMH